MKLSLAWVQEFTDIDRSVEELAELIGSRLVEVEEIINWRERFTGVMVAEILEVTAHTNADKLNIYKIKINDSDTRQVVSGDKKLKVGDKVGYIPPGVTVPVTFADKKPVVIQEVTMRGVQSQGMLGSGRELCLNEDHSGVLALDTDKPAGTTLLEAYNLDDIILEIENKSFTHRPDCFGLLGLAREIAAIQGHQFESPTWFTSDTIQIKKGAGNLPLTVTNNVPELVPRYTAVSISDIKIAPSSLMMQSLLLRMGVRPINNIVDVTNYLMLLTGQPLHAFDYDKVVALSSKKAPVEIVVRQAVEGDKLKLLDGRDIDIRPGAVVITTPDKPLAIGGVMGGAESEIDETTTNIIIESATFDMYNVRVTGMTHGLFTEALTRFAKGQSPSITAPVLGHAIGMVLEENTDAKIACELVDLYPVPKVPAPISLSAQWLNNFLGIDLESSQISAMLRRIECTVQDTDGRLIVTPPLWRSDVTIAEDITDEVGRLYGFDNITPTMSQRDFTPIMGWPSERLKESIREFLSRAGANEALTYSFVSQNLLEQTNQETGAAYHLSNSLSPELAYVRTNLLGSLLSKVRMNHKAGFDAFALYEIGQTESKLEQGPDALPLEQQTVAFICSTNDKAYDMARRGAPYYQGKHYLDELLHNLGVNEPHYRLLRPHTVDSVPPWLRLRVGMFDLNRSAIVVKGDVILGVVGEPAASVRKALKLPKAVAMFELNLAAILQVKAAKKSYRPLSRFPATEQDICFKASEELLYNDLTLAVNDFLSRETQLQFTIQPVDIFQRTDDIAHKQITIRLKLWRYDRTLTTDEVNELLGHLATHIRSVLRAERV